MFVLTDYYGCLCDLFASLCCVCLVMRCFAVLFCDLIAFAVLDFGFYGVMWFTLFVRGGCLVF